MKTGDKVSLKREYRTHMPLRIGVVQYLKNGMATVTMRSAVITVRASILEVHCEN
jgi:hypothetical protein